MNTFLLGFAEPNGSAHLLYKGVNVMPHDVQSAFLCVQLCYLCFPFFNVFMQMSEKILEVLSSLIGLGVPLPSAQSVQLLF